MKDDKYEFVLIDDFQYCDWKTGYLYFKFEEADFFQLEDVIEDVKQYVSYQNEQWIPSTDTDISENLFDCLHNEGAYSFNHNRVRAIKHIEKDGMHAILFIAEESQ